MESIMGRSVFTATFLLSCLIGSVTPRGEEGHGGGSCGSNADVRIQANYRPGVITLDGRADDWAQVDGFDFSLLPALHPDAGDSYRHGKMTVKALHDGREVFLLLQVDGVYSYSKGKKEDDDDDKEDEEDKDDDDDDNDGEVDRKESKFECGFHRSMYRTTS